MAVDEYLFRTLGPDPATILRFYQWDRPTASLGCGQEAARVVDREACRANKVGLVRRPTGGKLVLHYREATYAVISSDVETFTETLDGSYSWIARALLCGLKNLGVEAALAGETPRDYIQGAMPCFSRPARNEIEVNGRKIIGSAQKRIGGCFLQHGSIPLAGDDGLLSRISVWKGDAAGARMTTVSEALARPVSFIETAEALIPGFTAQGNIRLEPFCLTTSDRAAVEDLRKKKYASDDWTIGRKDPDA